MSCCWVSKSDDVENEKNHYKTDERNKKGKYKHLFYATILIRKIFHSLLNAYKDSYKLLIMSRVLCSDEFLIKRSDIIKKKFLFPLLVKFAL